MTICTTYIHAKPVQAVLHISKAVTEVCFLPKDCGWPQGESDGEKKYNELLERFYMNSRVSKWQKRVGNHPLILLHVCRYVGRHPTFASHYILYVKVLASKLSQPAQENINDPRPLKTPSKAVQSSQTRTSEI